MDLSKGEKVKAAGLLKVGQRLVFFPPEEESGYASRIEDIEDNKLLIAMPMDRHGVPIIPARGQRVNCKVLGEHGYYTFDTVYNDLDRIPIPVLCLEYPEIMRKVQSREFVRVKMSRPVVIRPIDEDGTIGEMIFSTTLDMSGGGIAFVHSEPLSIGSLVMIEIDNIPNAELMDLKGEIVRCAPVEADGRTIYHIGAKFHGIGQRNQNQLIKYIFEIQRKNLAKGVGRE